jgi:hypothetical protein
VSNFLDLEPEDAVEPKAEKLRQLVTRIPVATPPTRLHPDLSDRLAEQHGFSSRESAPPRFLGGRRQPRGVQVEQTRQLSIRMPVSLYEDFVSFADTHRLTYNEAIRALLDRK